MDEKEKIEQYLVDVVGRLMDVQEAFSAIEVHAYMEKIALIKDGKDFRYQQAIIDIVSEIRKYATGEVDLHKIMDEMIATQKQVNNGTRGMEVI